MARIVGNWDMRSLVGNATTDNVVLNGRLSNISPIELGNLPRDIKINASSGYNFINGGNIQLIDTDNSLIWTIYPKKNNNKKIIVSLTEKEQIFVDSVDDYPTIKFNIKAYKTETLNLKGEHFTAFQSYDEYLQHSPLEIGDNLIPRNTNYSNPTKNTFTVKADEGYVLTNIHVNSTNPEKSNNFDVDNIDENETTFSVNFYGQSNIEIIVTTEEVKTPEPELEPEPEPDNNRDDYNFTIFNAIYYMDKDNLVYLANALPSINLGDESRNEVAPYIINLLRLPFAIPEKYIGDKKIIKIGNRVYDTDADGVRQAETIDTDLITLNLGNIKVPHKYNNTYDFVNTDIFLNIPNSQKIELPIEYIIGYNVDIEFIVNLFNGEGTLNIYSSKTNTVIHSEVLQLGQEIPYFMNREKTSVGNVNIQPIVNNKIKQPFIEVIRNKPINDDMFLNKVEKTGYLKDITGYAEITNVKMNIEATTDEISKIENLLREGVIFNG